MPRARNTDPKTSHDAADKVADVSLTQSFILQALKRPRTDTELVEVYRKLKRAPRASESGIRSRRAELVAKGLVVDSGNRGLTEFNRQAIVWAANG